MQVDTAPLPTVDDDDDDPTPGFIGEIPSPPGYELVMGHDGERVLTAPITEWTIMRDMNWIVAIPAGPEGIMEGYKPDEQIIRMPDGTFWHSDSGSEAFDDEADVLQFLKDQQVDD